MKALLKSWRIWLVIFFLLLSVWSIAPHFGQDGVTITSVVKGSAADAAGITGPAPGDAPTQRERILAVSGAHVNSPGQFLELISDFDINDTVRITTTDSVYLLTVQPLNETITLPEQETVTIEEFDPQRNETINVTVTQNKTVTTTIGAEPLGIRVSAPASTNIRKGLDLQGGTRVLMQPESYLPPEDMELLIEGMKQRLNVFGLSDIIVREASDLSGNTFVRVEVAGVNEESVRELLGNQGKFEAFIGEEVAFRGGNDILNVCRSAECAGIDPQRGCFQTDAASWACSFRFSITLSQEAASRQWNIIRDVPVIADPLGGESFLEEDLRLYLDDEEVDSLRIAASLKQSPATQISISGSGEGPTRDAAIADALANMQSLQTILITGSLPVKLDIVQTESLSPVLGEQFTRNALQIALAAIIAVSVLLLLIYRSFKVAVPMILTSLSEIVIMLGIASLIHWNIDLAAVAGIIAAVGTGVNDQIIIAEEALRGEFSKIYSWKEKVKSAFFIIMGAYLTTVVAMMPLLFAGAGILRGFALITIIGVSVGVFVTRPAFAKAMEVLYK